jgi:ribosome-associated protein
MSDFKHFDNDEDDLLPSKTQLKQEAAELQKLGLELVELGDKYLAQIGLEGNLGQAVYDARNMKHREGRRRQLQLIGKLMRHTDHEVIRNKLDKVKNIGRQHAQITQQTEILQQQLLNDGNQALQDFISDFPHCEMQHLRQLIRNSQKELAKLTGEDKSITASSRKLFIYIREVLESDGL